MVPGSSWIPDNPVCSKAYESLLYNNGLVVYYPVREEINDEEEREEAELKAFCEKLLRKHKGIKKIWG
ncbi:hypothetical protein D3C74_414300 [compost metagenome]